MSNQYLRKWKLTISPPLYDIYLHGDLPLSSYTKISEKHLDQYKRWGEIKPTTEEALVFTDPLRIEFRATKTALASPPMAEITLWNLSPEIETKLLMEGSQITLEAGYEDSCGVIYKGVIIQPIRGKKNTTDFYTKFICLSEDHFWNLAFTEGTIAPNVKRKELVKQILRSTYNTGGLEIEDLDIPDTNAVDGSSTALERPKVLFGNPRDYIRNAAKMSNTSPYIEDNKLKFLAFDDTPPKFAHEVNIETGMVGEPTQSNEYLNVQVLLNPNMKIGEYIHIDNKKVLVQQLSDIRDHVWLLDRDGLYKIIGIEYVGDSRGNTWYSNLMVISKNGKLAAPLTNGRGELIT